MSRTTLCDPPKCWKSRVDSLKNDGLSADKAEVLLRVELCINLLEFLKWREETVGIVPFLLSGLTRYGEKRTPTERRAIANVRQIAPYSSASAWHSALEEYAGIPAEFRAYRFPEHPLSEPSEIDESDDGAEGEKTPASDTATVARTAWMVDNLLPGPGANRYPQNQDLYQTALTEELEHHKRGGELAKPDVRYEFTAASSDGAKHKYNITYPKTLPMLPVSPWLVEPSRSREPITVHLRRDLVPIAEELDRLDNEAGRKSKNWVERLSHVRYRRVGEDGAIDETCPDEITLNGFHHAAGMVASGKSTLAFLLAAWVIGQRPDLRISIVVGDVQSALRLADELNTYFRADIEKDTPVAVPLLGRRSRDKHLRDLHGSREYQERRQQGKGHWGERFLSVVCPAQALIAEPDSAPLPSGQEPCANLRVPRTRRHKGQATDSDQSN